MFHFSILGCYAPKTRDRDGYVPDISDDPWDFDLDHGGETTHNENGELTDYGRWWEEEGFPAWRDKAIEETADSEAAIAKWESS